MTKGLCFSIFSFFVFGLVATGALAAEPTDLTMQSAKGFLPQLSSQPGTALAPQNSLVQAFGLAPSESFELVRSRVDFNGVTHRRYRQKYMGIPFWGAEVAISQDSVGNARSLFGRVVQGIPADVGAIGQLAAFDPEAALQMQIDQRIVQSGLPASDVNVRNEETGLYICLNSANQAYLCYVVSFFIDGTDLEPTQPIFFIDASTGETVNTYDALRHADGTGPGGNVKIGQYQYGTDFPAFFVTQSGSTCTMDSTDVKTVDLNHGSSGSTAFSYPCFENTHKEINGAYSPLNDAHFFGFVVFDMFNQWYNVPPLPFKLTLRCHYQNSYENAFWDGSTMTFGDGANTFHPLVSLDVVAHEVSHGFTETNSNLTYSGQSGGINEAFSDMAGEAGEFFMRGSNDFKIGYDIYKAAGQALRYMEDPPLDGRSIGHVSDYTAGMDVHYSSGVFNKAFYLIASTAGWTTQKAFDIFVKANQDYWTASTNFQQGAEGALSAAIDHGYSCGDVRDAFAVVGISLTCTNEPQANFTFETYADNLNASFTDTSTCSGCTLASWSWAFGDGNSSTVQSPTHTYAAGGTYSVTLTVTDTAGLTSSATKSVTVPFVPNYCASQGNNSTDEWIVNVAIGTFSHASGASNYSDFTDQVIPLALGDTYNVTLTPQFDGGPWTEHFRIWIDYNRDGDFTDAGEEVFAASGTSEVSGSFTVATSASSSPTRLRVTMKYNAVPSPCEAFAYGEVEDYTVDFSGTSNQPPTVGITSPADGDQFSAGDTVTITADAADSDGSVSKVEFFAGSTKLGEDTSSPYSYAWAGVAVGNHTLTAVATDNQGASTTSAGVGITVNPTGCVTLYATDFESGADGWAHSASDSTCTTGDWGVGDPDSVSNGGVVTQLEDDHTAAPGVNALFTEPNTGGAGTNDVDGGVCTGLSPVIDASAHALVEVSLWYYHGQRDAGDDASGDYFNIDLSTDGGATYSQNLVSFGDVTSNAAWTEVKVNVNNPGQLRIRVQASDGAGPGDLVEGGIDDVLVCVPE